MRIDKVIVCDSSSLIALERRNKLEVLFGMNCYIPHAIFKELVDDAFQAAERQKVKKNTYLYFRLRESALTFKRCIEQGSILLRGVNHRRYSRLIDQIRVRLSSLDVKPEHKVKKGDCEVIALAAEFLEEGIGVKVLIEDGNLRDIIHEKIPEAEVISFSDLI